MECIAKGIGRTPYEFGVKTSVAVAAKEGVVVGMRSMPGSPYDGHTPHSQLEQAEILTGVKPSLALADQGYRGVQSPEGTNLLLSHTQRAAQGTKEAAQAPPGHRTHHRAHEDRRAAGARLAQGLKGCEVDAIHAVLCGAGHNLRLILVHLRVLLLAMIGLLALGASILVPGQTARQTVPAP